MYVVICYIVIVIVIPIIVISRYLVRKQYEALRSVRNYAFMLRHNARS